VITSRVNDVDGELSVYNVVLPFLGLRRLRAVGISDAMFTRWTEDESSSITTETLSALCGSGLHTSGAGVRPVALELCLGGTLDRVLTSKSSCEKPDFIQ